MIYKTIVRPVLFCIDAEKAHKIACNILQVLSKTPLINRGIKTYFNIPSNIKTPIESLVFKSPIGLAAGFDKNAEYIDALSLLGFGFIEIGTITPKPQFGNPKPRLFRLPKSSAIVNRMGFNNVGVEQAIKHIKTKKSDVILGINIGKNKNTPIKNAIEDYIICFRKMKKYADYFTVNVSSPNTPNLRELQQKESLNQLLRDIQKENVTNIPVFLKIAPDIDTKSLDDIIQLICDNKLTGIICTNTTIDRPNSTEKYVKEEGGLSGKPLKHKANTILKYIHTKRIEKQLKLKIIASGGVCTADDAIEKIKLGADLVQVYSGFIYQGPSLLKHIHNYLSHDKNNGMSS